MFVVEWGNYNLFIKWSIIVQKKNKWDYYYTLQCG